jgi:flagellar hook-associated protein 3 FlgL
MRISSQQVFDSNLKSIQQHTSDVVEAQRQISSGQKYRLASDDALAAGLGVQIAWDKSQFAMFKVNQDHVNASLSSTDAQLNSINIAMTKFQQMIVQGRNDPLGSDGRKILGQQAESLIAAVTQFANAKDANGQNILRTTPVSMALIAPSVSLESGLSFNDVMVGPVGTGKDVLAIMRSVKDKLVAGNSPSDEDMVNFQAALTQVTRAQVQTGLLQNQLDAATEAAEVQKTNVELQRSNLLDTDLATATASLVKSNALLQAAQSVMTKLDVNTLFQKL